MKRVTKVLSKTVDALKDIGFHIYNYDEEADREISVTVDSDEDAEKAALELMSLLFDPKEADKELETITRGQYRMLTTLWLPTLIQSIYSTLEYILQEELGKAIHEDMESLWVKMEKLEERVKELELKA